MRIRSRLSGNLILFALTALLVRSTIVTASPTQPKLAADNSLTTAQYVNIGVPAIDRPWTPEDFQKAAGALTELAQKDATKLPRFHSKASGAVFAHLVDQKNLDLVTDKGAPVEKRLHIVGSVESYAALYVLYSNTSTPERAFDSERLELMGFLLRAEVAAGQVLNEYFAAHPEAKDANGYHTMCANMATTLGGLFSQIVDLSSFRGSESVRFAAELKPTISTIKPFFGSAEREALKKQLQDEVGAQESPELKNALAELLVALK